MRDEGDGARERVDEALEPREPFGVEVVGRLVEEQQVGLHEEDRRERRSRLLAPGQSFDRSFELDAQPETTAHHACARVEVAPSERQEARERRVVAVGQRSCCSNTSVVRRRTGERGRGALELPLGRGDAGRASETVAKRLGRSDLGLLREVGDRRLGRIELDPATVGSLDTREEPQDRRLPDAVRPDEADPRVPSHVEGRVLEDDLGSVGLGDADETRMHDGGDLLERTGAAGSRERLRGALSPRSVRHGRAPERAPTVAASVARVAAQRLERRPARVDRLVVVLVRLHVQVLAADGAEPCAVGSAEELVGHLERELVASPGADVEVPLDDVLRPQLVVPGRVGRLVLLGVDQDRQAQPG